MAAWFLVSSTGDTIQAVALRQGIQRGAQITNADIMVVDVPRDTPLALVPGDQIDTVAGQVAQTELLPGQLLVPGTYGPELQVPRGQAVVGVVPVSHPGQVLHAEDQVRLVLGTTKQGKLPEPVQAWDATVVRTATVPGTSGEEFCVDVEVDASDADLVMAASATGRLTIALVHGEPR